MIKRLNRITWLRINNFVHAIDVSLKKLTMTHTLKKMKEIPKRDKTIINDKQLKQAKLGTKNDFNDIITKAYFDDKLNN